MTILCTFSLLVNAQNATTEPLNPQWIEYQSNKNNIEQSTMPLGAIPSPTQWHFANNNQPIRTSTKSFPSVYDLRTAGPGGTSLLSPVRDQGTCGSCWTFGTFGSLESHLKKSGAGIFDFSENNLKECHRFYFGPCNGGNVEMSTAYLTRHSGPVNESDDPYFDSMTGCNGDFNSQFLISDAVFLPNIADTIKQAIIDHGALYTTMDWNVSNYNSANYTYYLENGENYNHIITLIGWDDNKSTAGGTGAWICQNSWGSSWGENGIFYISYNDAVVNISVAYFKHKENMSNNFFTLYQQDELGATSAYGYDSHTGIGLVKYVAENNFPLKSIGTYAKSSNTDIFIAVYDDFDGNSTSNFIGYIDEIHCDHPGYYTFDFETPIPVTEGDDFYIYVHYTTPETTYPIPIEVSFDDYALATASNKTWTSQYGGAGTWFQTDYDLAVKVFAQADISVNLINKENESCFGIADGAISIEAWGGTPPYNYSWNTEPTQTSNTIENLSAGTYNCTISDSNEKTTIYTYTITSPPPIITYADNIDHCECPGDENGSISIFSPDITYNETFANSVISVTSSDNIFPASNLLGEPDNQSWSANYTMDSQTIILEFENPSRSNGVSIYEKVGSGSIVSCFLRNANTEDWENVWTGDQFFEEHDSVFTINFPPTNYPVDAIKIISAPSETDWAFYPLIDAVSILAPDECDYIWSNELTSNTIENLAAGEYSVTITNESGCAQIETFVIEEPDPLHLTAMQDATVCEGSEICLTAVSNGVLSWFESGSTTPLTSNCVEMSEETQFIAHTETIYGYLNDTVNIYTQPLPETPIISLSGLVVQSNYESGNQWYNQDGIIVGADEQFYTVTEDGTYYSIVTIDECSSEPSNEIEVLGTKIKDSERKSQFSIYPNPFSDYLIIQNHNRFDNTSFEIFNSIGESVCKDEFLGKTQINTKELSSGLYLIIFSNTEILKFIKED